jgi:NADPH2:quinone reductase
MGATMTAIEISEPGGPEVLVAATRPRPEPGAGQVLIQVEAAGVNRPDCLQRLGVYPAPPGVTDILGLEVAGTIAGVGAGVLRWKEGDRVCALLPGGGYAEYAVADEGSCLPIPFGLSAKEAAILPETVFTVWLNVFERAQLAPGESLLVQGGTSGIGVTAIQMAKAFGHRVFATAGTEKKCEECVRLGADRAINYRREDFSQIVLAETGGKGVDVILDMVAGEYLPRELACLAVDGRLSIIAMLGGFKAEIDASQILFKRLTISGSSLRPRSNEFKARLARTVEEKVWPLVEAGTFKPIIDSTFPLQYASDAHARMESAHVGKIALTVR